MGCGTPRGLAGGTRALGCLAQEGRRWTTLTLGRASVGIAALALYAFLTKSSIAFLLLLIAIVAVRRAVPARPKGPEPAVPAPGESFEATVEIRRGGVLLGEDEAVVTFVEGWLHVEGNQTAFALSSLDLGPPQIPSIWRTVTGLLGAITFAGDRYPPLDPEAFRRVDLEGGTELRFFVHAGERERIRFAQTLRSWKTGDAACGESTLPPDEVHPSISIRPAAGLLVSTLGSAFGLWVALRFGLGRGALAWLLIPGPPVHQAVMHIVRQRRLVRRA